MSANLLHEKGNNRLSNMSVFVVSENGFELVILI